MKGVKIMETTTTPVIEKVHINEAALRITAVMELAGVPVVIAGNYSVSQNVFRPWSVFTPDYSKETDFEEYCEAMGWDYDDTYREVQEAVENR